MEASARSDASIRHRLSIRHQLRVLDDVFVRHDPARIRSSRSFWRFRFGTARSIATTGSDLVPVVLAVPSRHCQQIAGVPPTRVRIVPRRHDSLAALRLGRRFVFAWRSPQPPGRCAPP
jgi:hypothetical protein